MQAIGKWLIQVVLGWVVKTIWPKIQAWFAELIEKWQRSRRQKAATEKLEENVQAEKPRDEKTRKEEEEWLNS